MGSGKVAWEVSIQPTTSSLTMAGIAAGPTNDVVVADRSGGTVFEQHRWNVSGTPLSVHQDAIGSYAGPFFTSSLVIDGANDLFYGLVRTGMPQGANSANELRFNRISPAGAVVFSDPTAGTLPQGSATPSVQFFFAGGDANGILHGPLLMNAPVAFSAGVYCYGANGFNYGPSAGGFLAGLSSKDVVWPASDAGLYVAHPVTASTDIGCGTVSVPAAGGIILAKMYGSGGCEWNKLIAAPTAAVKASAFHLGADFSLTLAVVYSGTVNLGAGSFQSTGSGSLAIAHYDAAGTLVWAKTFGGAGSITSLGSVAVNNMSLTIVTGGYAGTPSFGGAALPSSDDTFLAVFDATGSLRWDKSVHVGQSGSLIAAASPCGLVLATNSPSVTLGPGTGPLSTVTPPLPASIGVAALGL